MEVLTQSLTLFRGTVFAGLLHTLLHSRRLSGEKRSIEINNRADLIIAERQKFLGLAHLYRMYTAIFVGFSNRYQTHYIPIGQCQSLQL